MTSDNNRDYRPVHSRGLIPILLIVALAFALVTTTVEAGGGVIAAVRILGNSSVKPAVITELLPIHVGDMATPDALQHAVEALNASGLFRTVKIDMKGTMLLVTVAENPPLAGILFEGNQRFSDANLLAMIDLPNRGSLDAQTEARDTQSIRSAYLDEGYGNVKVTARNEPQPQGRTRVTFAIEEGSRVGVVGIHFTGNSAIDSGTLKSIIKTHETWFLSWLLHDDTFNQQQIDSDRELIRQYYGTKGFPDAQVTAIPETDTKTGGYFVAFTVAEGEQYRYGTVGIETSIADLNADGLDGLLRTRRGEFVSTSELQTSTDNLATEAAQSGHPFAEVRARLDRNSTTGLIDVTYLIDKGQRIYVERINIAGNTKTRDFVIRRELEFAEGDPFNRSTIARDKKKLEALGFFSKVDVSLAEGSAADKVVVDITVTEGSTAEIGASLGYDSSDGVLGELSLTERDFLGRGEYFKASIGATSSGRTYELAFTEPRVGNLNISAGFDLYQRTNDESDDASNPVYFGTTRTGIGLTSSVPIVPLITGSLLAGYEQIAISDSSSPDSVIFSDGAKYNKTWVGYGLSFDGLDDDKRPTQGLIATFNQQYEGADFNLLKTEAKARLYAPLLPGTGIIGSVRASGGLLTDFAGATTSVLESYSYGGQIVRGFENGDMGPRAAGSGEPLGYTAYAAGSAEVSFPIPLLPETYGLSGSIWADAAVVGSSAGGISVAPSSIDQPLKASIGASIIWDSSFGPLRGDFAYVLSKATDDKTQFFQLTLKTAL